MFNLLSLLFILNLKKIKEISPKSKFRFKAIVLSKSGGVEDLIYSQRKYNQNILYVNCSRKFFSNIYATIFNSYQKKSKYISKKKIKDFKKEYLNFLIFFLKILKKKYAFQIFIGFNFNYHAERDLHEACQKLRIPFLLLYKESVLTELEKKYLVYTAKKSGEKFNGYKIAVYSNSARKSLIDSQIVKKDKIEVVGCSRLGISYSFKKVLPKNQILYYAIQDDRGLPNRFIKKFGKEYFKNFKLNKLYNANCSWRNLHIKTLKILKRFAVENPKISIIIKIKNGEKNNKIEYSNLPKNIKIHKSGVGHNLLKRSKVIIAWNTTSILEGIAANRFILMPYFFKKNENLKKTDELIFKLKNKNYGHSENDFYKKLYFFIKKKYKKNEVYNNQNSLEYYLGNLDNNAGMRLNKFLQSNLSYK
ncbi:hypothetical protein N8724_01395 [Candidatus Pelagibacter sp.]|nr:hypothetical protein [Candidatus Pelagibacter sp.]